MFREVIRLLQLGTNEALHRPGEDNASPLPAGLHAAVSGPGDEKRAVRVDCHHLPPVRKGILLIRVNDLHPGVGHHEVAGMELLHHPVKPGLHFPFVRYVHPNGNSPASGGGQLLHNGPGAVQIQIRHDNAVALFRHSQSAGLADSRRRASNQYCFHVLLLPVLRVFQAVPAL